MAALIRKPDLFFALVGTVGTDLDRVTSAIRRALTPYLYETVPVRLAQLLHTFDRYSKLPTTFVDEYIDAHMTAGNDFRELAERSDALAVLTAGYVSLERSKRVLPRDAAGRAWIFRSLKHPDEAKTLRRIYGDSFYLIAAYSPEQARRTHVAKRIARSRNSYPFDRFTSVADCLINRDHEELGVPHGQNTRDTFHRADLFVDMNDNEKMSEAINRFVELLFGNTFHTPSRAEYAMFHAQAAALRSAELGRQVGAAISTSDGDIVAVGTNEVPRAGGGLYWAGDTPDMREFRRSIDASEEQKRALLAETIKYLQAAGWFAAKFKRADIDDLLTQCLDPKRPLIPKEAKIRNIIEYGRAVHAEMASITDAARRGVSIAGAEMYVTTFPCHLCARLIVASGLKTAVYIEPYPRSLTAELYPDSIRTDALSTSRRQVIFKPFVGIAPSQYRSLFTMGKRKDDGGRPVMPNPTTAEPRYYEEEKVYLERADEEVLKLNSLLAAKRSLTRRLTWRSQCPISGSVKP